MSVEEQVEKIMESKGKERKKQVHLIVGHGEDKPLLELSAWVPMRVVNELMQQFGFYLEKPKPMRPIALRPSPRVSCPFKENCADYPDKCSECVHNKAKNYFTPKAKEES